MIKELLFACALGLCASIYYVQSDQWYRQTIANIVCKQLASSLSCSMAHYTIKDLSMPSGSLSLGDVTMKPHDASSWQWSAVDFTLKFSWVELLLYGTLDLILELSDIAVYSEFHQNKLAIKSHIDGMLSNGKSDFVPIIIKQLCMKNAHLVVHNNQGETLHTLNGSLVIKKINNALRTMLHIKEGSATYCERNAFHSLKGSIECNILAVETHPDITLQGSCNVHIPYLDATNTQCNLLGSWKNNQGSVSLKNNNNSLDITTHFHNRNISLVGHTPISMLYRYMYDTYESKIDGICKIQAKGSLDKSHIKGSLLFKEINSAGNHLSSLAQCTFEKIKHAWSGSLYAQRKHGISCGGSWRFNQKIGHGSVNLTNNSSLSIPSSMWYIPTHNAYISCDFDDSYNINGIFNCTAAQTKTQCTFRTEGLINSHDNIISMSGSAGDKKYITKITLLPYFCINSIEYVDNQNKHLIQLSQQKNNNLLSGTVDFNFVREILNSLYTYDLQGKGILKTSISTKNNLLYLSTELVDGTIRIPQTYNFINKFSTNIALDWTQKTAILSDTYFHLHKGTMQSKHTKIQFGNDCSPSFCFSPIIFNNCLLNIQKDLFATITGRVFVQKLPHKPLSMKGSVMVDNAQLNENILSHNVQQSLMQNAKNIFSSSYNNMLLDINVHSVHPVRVKTPFLETDAHINLALSNTITQPNVTGSIQLHSGELAFPYKPLYFNKGSIIFMPNQLYDPMIELEARNNIKKYNISMHVTGSVKKHHISLSSNPTLSEEQIIALLLVGSQEESLNIVMPALIMQNVKQLIFGSEQNPNKFGQYFTNFLKPLKHITLVPSFVDQTGRGGLRGTIEINIYDRLRALIQKNFDLTEDTRFEIEYQLSDDMSLRGVRDERRDVSGELEMRWKF